MYDDNDISLNQPASDAGNQMLEDSEDEMMQHADPVFSNRHVLLNNCRLGCKLCSRKLCLSPQAQPDLVLYTKHALLMVAQGAAIQTRGLQSSIQQHVHISCLLC